MINMKLHGCLAGDCRMKNLPPFFGQKMSKIISPGLWRLHKFRIAANGHLCNRWDRADRRHAKKVVTFWTFNRSSAKKKSTNKSDFSLSLCRLRSRPPNFQAISVCSYSLRSRPRGTRAAPAAGPFAPFRSVSLKGHRKKCMCVFGN